MTPEPRSRSARARAETALVRLVKHMGTHAHEVVVIGGLVPDVLTVSPLPHQGTTDVDLLLSLGFAYDRDQLDLGWIEASLLGAGFTEDPRTGSGWRWLITLDRVVVRLGGALPLRRSTGLRVPAH